MADFHTLKHRVLFRECDSNGLVHPSNYFRWFEDTRFLIAKESKIIQFIEDIHSVTFPVIYSDCSFYHSIETDVDVQIRTTLKIEGSGILAFRHLIVSDIFSSLIADGTTKVVVVLQEQGVIKTIDRKIQEQITRYTKNYEEMV